MSITRQQAEGMMMDLLYGELAESDRPAMEAYLAGDAELRGEYESLQGVRAVLADVRTDAATGATIAQDTPPRRRSVRRFLRVLVPIAAAAMILVGFWVLQSPDGPGVETTYAGPTGPVSIEPLNVSLTILSKPAPKGQGDNWADRQMPLAQTLGPVNAAGWSGMALVRDRRLGRNLPVGQSTVSFTGVPSGILPDSVRLRSLDDPGGLSILEQNYQYDLASSAAILDRYIEKDVTVAFKDDTRVTGQLVSVAKSGQSIQSFTIQPSGEGPRIVAVGQVASVSLAKLPTGLLTTPTLQWTLDNRRRQPQQFEVAYLTKGLSWRADYMLTLRASDATQTDGALFDLADLTGYATVTNLSGVTYKDAQLKLMAGDVNLVQPEMQTQEWEELELPDDDLSDGISLGFKQKSFFEYHLYTLGQATTLADRETKQIELVTGSGMKMKRGYVYDPQKGNKRNMLVVSELENTKENGLGKPLPKGVVRLYAPDPEGELQPVGKTEIDHTPVKEKLRFQWGMAFDLIGEFREIDARYSGQSGDRTHEYTLRNHKSHPVTITVIVHVPPTTWQLTCWDGAKSKSAGGKPHPWHVRQVGMVEIDLRVPANGERKLYVPYAWRSENGGNLKSPYDAKSKN